jgi:hypothetical protein
MKTLEGNYVGNADWIISFQEQKYYSYYPIRISYLSPFLTGMVRVLYGGESSQYPSGFLNEMRDGL